MEQCRCWPASSGCHVSPRQTYFSPWTMDLDVFTPHSFVSLPSLAATLAVAAGVVGLYDVHVALLAWTEANPFEPMDGTQTCGIASVPAADKPQCHTPLYGSSFLGVDGKILGVDGKISFQRTGKKRVLTFAFHRDWECCFPTASCHVDTVFPSVCLTQQLGLLFPTFLCSSSEWEPGRDVSSVGVPSWPWVSRRWQSRSLVAGSDFSLHWHGQRQPWVLSIEMQNGAGCAECLSVWEEPHHFRTYFQGGCI